MKKSAILALFLSAALSAQDGVGGVERPVRADAAWLRGYVARATHAAVWLPVWVHPLLPPVWVPLHVPPPMSDPFWLLPVPVIALEADELP